MAKILIVDDSKTSRKFLSEALNGAEALEMFETHTPDIVTMDITMPVMDGVEALKELKLAHPEAKVVMVTAAGQKNNMVECIKLGACEFIQKPFDRDKILETIESIIGNNV